MLLFWNDGSIFNNPWRQRLIDNTRGQSLEPDVYENYDARSSHLQNTRIKQSALHPVFFMSAPVFYQPTGLLTLHKPLHRSHSSFSITGQES